MRMHALIGGAAHFAPHLMPGMPNDAVKIAGKSCIRIGICQDSQPKGRDSNLRISN